MSQPISPTAEPGTARRAHVTTTRTLDLSGDEQAVIGHMRGWCHDSTVCALCTALNDTERWRVHHRTEELRRIDTEISHAHLARDLMAAQAQLDSIISG